MSLSLEQSQLLKAVYQRLKDEPLMPNHQLYEPIYEELDVDDPVERMFFHIENNEIESFQLFSGFRGSGKTTELYRLRRKLENQGAVVLYADALAYLNPSEPVEAPSLLMAIAGGFSDALEAVLGKNVSKETWWQRLTNYLTTTSLEVTEASASLEADSPARDVLGGLNGGVELKFALKDAPSFRQKLALFLENRLPALKAQVNAFVEEAVKLIQKKHGANARIVFIFDQLEQVRGSSTTESSVIKSVERIFTTHVNLLRLPLLHTIYTVPPWLRFAAPGAVAAEILPTVRLWKNDPTRTPNRPGLDALVRLLNRRLGGDGASAIFGPAGKTHNSLAEKLITASGGHFRDLMRLLRELIVRIQTQSQALPVDSEIVDRAIEEIRGQYLPIAEDDAVWLARIATERQPALASVAPDQVIRLSRFLDDHLVLYFSNGKEWYDIHPLIREEVSRLAPPIKTRKSSPKK